MCDHIGIVSGDAKKLSKFYIDKLGFRKEKEEVLKRPLAEEIFGIPSEILFIRLEGKNGFKVEFFEPISFRVRRSRRDITGLHHWGLSVGNREKFVTELKKKRVEVVEVRRNASTAYFMKDADGNMIEIRD